MLQYEIIGSDGASNLNCTSSRFRWDVGVSPAWLLKYTVVPGKQRQVHFSREASLVGYLIYHGSRGNRNTHLRLNDLNFFRAVEAMFICPRKDI